MIGLVYLLFFALYLLISAYVIYRATLYARRKYNKGWVGGWLAAFLMYNLVFWNWIPVYVMHKYYCATEAGFWVYKSPEQWIKENSGAVDTVLDKHNWGNTWWGEQHLTDILPSGTQRYWYSKRIYLDISYSSVMSSISRSERRFIDAKTGLVLSRAVEFFRGSPGALSTGANDFSDYKIWLGFGNIKCGPGRNHGYIDFLHKYDIALGKLFDGDKQ